jgi:prevent-host-death family protein
MKIEIGALEAKTKLPELLRQVQDGKQFTITNRGRPVADLVPTRAMRPKDPAAAIDKFLAFKKKHPAHAKVDLRALVEDGRR